MRLEAWGLRGRLVSRAAFPQASSPEPPGPIPHLPGFDVASGATASGRVALPLNRAWNLLLGATLTVPLLWPRFVVSDGSQTLRDYGPDLPIVPGVELGLAYGLR